MTLVAIEVGYQDTASDDPTIRGRRWTPEAGGHTYWIYPVELDEIMAVDVIADAVFIADNSPHSLPETSLAGRIRAAMIAAYAETDRRHHSLSDGDRVRVSEAEVVCTANGWRRVRV